MWKNFIWNDCQFAVVGKEKEYDRSQCFVVRKLFIRLRTANNFVEKCQIFDERSIKRDFEVYGNVESVELLRLCKHDKCSIYKTVCIVRPVTYPPERHHLSAYVTFKHDYSAALAIRNSSLDTLQKNLVNQRWLIEPAYTWHQPFSLSKHGLRTRLLDMVSIDAATEAKPTLHRLTDECLDEIFKRCELRSLVNLFQVCRRFRNQFLRPDGHLSSRYFRKFRTIRIDACGTEMKTYDSVGMARKCLRRAGPFVQKVVFCCDDLHHACVPSYLKKIDQYAGDQFSELELIDVVITQDNLQFFKPLLNRIRVLRINDMTRSSTYASDWNTNCPNLETLEIKRNGLPLRMNVALSWWSTPILKSLSVDFDLSLSLQAIIFRCQQLEHFKFKCHRNGSLNLLPALRNIRHLEIEDVKSLRLVNFSGFLQLKQLTLKFLNSHYDQIIATINGPTELRELKLMTFRAVAHEPALISLIKRLPDLEILYLYGISIERTAVINILRHAVNLKAFHFSHFDGHFDRSLIAEIVSICEIEQRQKPIELFISKTIKHRDLAALIDSNDQRFVRIQLEGLNYYIA